MICWKLQSRRDEYVGLVMFNAWKTPEELDGYLPWISDDGINRDRPRFTNTTRADIEPIETTCENACLKTLDSKV